MMTFMAQGTWLLWVPGFWEMFCALHFLEAFDLGLQTKAFPTGDSGRWGQPLLASFQKNRRLAR